MEEVSKVHPLVGPGKDCEGNTTMRVSVLGLSGWLNVSPLKLDFYISKHGLILVCFMMISHCELTYSARQLNWDWVNDCRQEHTPHSVSLFCVVVDSQVWTSKQCALGLGIATAGTAGLLAGSTDSWPHSMSLAKLMNAPGVCSLPFCTHVVSIDIVCTLGT